MMALHIFNKLHTNTTVKNPHCIVEQKRYRLRSHLSFDNVLFVDICIIVMMSFSV